MSHRFKMSIALALITSMIVFVGCFFLLTIVREKRVNDLANHSITLSRNITETSLIHDFLTDKIGIASKEDVLDRLQTFVNGDPFIDELVFMDRFGKLPLRVVQKNYEDTIQPSGALLSIHEILSKGQPFLDEAAWIYFIPIHFSSETEWGVLRVRWKPEATWKLFRMLKQGIAYTTAFTFLLMFLLSYLVFMRSFQSDFYRMNRILSHVISGDYSKRFDTQSYSGGMAEIATYMNRILMDIEEERQKGGVIDDTLRQVERNCAEYRKALADKDKENKQLRKDMADGLIEFFDIAWDGVLIINHHYQIQFMNGQAERILRFAKIVNGEIVDETLRGCLKPLFTRHKKRIMDEVCQWSQAGNDITFSCRIRCSQVPVCDDEQLFFLLLQEEKSPAEKHASLFLSERLVVDVLANIDILAESPQQGTDAHEQILRIIRKLSVLNTMEKNQLDRVRSVPLQKWLRSQFEVNDLLSLNHYINTSGSDIDVTVRIPENVLEELIDSIIRLIFILIEESGSRLPNKAINLIASVDEQGKPVITVSIPGLHKVRAKTLHNMMDEKMKFNHERYSLLEFEKEVCYSLYCLTKQILQIRSQCYYSDNKDITSIRLTLQNDSFASSNTPQRSKNRMKESENRFLHEYLTKIG
jgi:hypothetical protein